MTTKFLIHNNLNQNDYENHEQNEPAEISPKVNTEEESKLFQ